MCGISGLVNCGDSETLGRMTAIQAHRGPDDAGLSRNKETVLAC
jgi:asparagine synthetase B (glutamine-hydrolysing)